MNSNRAANLISENRVEASASNHDRLSSVFRAARLTLSRQTNQPARSWPAHSVDSTRVACHPNPRSAKVHKYIPPDVWLGRSFPTPRPRQVHRPERASTNHTQMSGNAWDAPHKPGKACHRNRRTAARKPVGGLFLPVTIQVQPVVGHHRPYAISRQQTRHHCSIARTSDRVVQCRSCRES